MTLKALFDEFVDLTHISKTSIIDEIYKNFRNRDTRTGIYAISCVRDWRTTPEGRLFWLDKDLKWRFYCLINVKRVKALQNYYLINQLSGDLEGYSNFAPEAETAIRKKIGSNFRSWQMRHKRNDLYKKN